MTTEDVHPSIEAWRTSRSGAWAGRGFHYQHLLSTLILVRQWAGFAPSGHLVPEGLEDCVVEFANHDIWLQIKSRKDKPFSTAEVQRILADLDAKAVRANGTEQNRKVVVLEQPRSGMSEATIDQLFQDASQSVFACAFPGAESVSLLTTRLGTAEVVADGIVSDLYRLVADASQANASLPFERRRRISTTEVERRIFERLEAEDPSAIDGALTSGALEPIDFGNPISEPAFYQGVKVIPGHVAAGLVLDRPDDTDNVIRALRRRRHVLITGPSGAGKSALMWLSANALTGELRWYQITARSVAADADAIIRFVRARRPTETSPIGLAFDEVGSTNSDLWDVLVRELRGLSSVYFIGSVRQEDVTLIANQADTEFVTVNLSAILAENMWRRLHAENQTKWEHWREPFEQSKGLMLEYVHLLTQGRRLAAVIDEQIRRRQREKRDGELAVIRCTATICARGGEIQAAKLFDLLGMAPDDASRALTRLLDEHLVRETRPGVLGGLHMLRSQALSKASHDEALYLTMDSLWRSLTAVTSETLPRVIQSVLTNAPDEDEATVLRKLAETLGASQDIETWVSVLTGLGLATLERGVASFINVLEQHEVQRAQWSLAAMFGDPAIDIPELTGFVEWQRLRMAVLAFRALPKSDLRRTCLEQLPAASAVPPCQNLQQANKFLSCLVPICGCGAIRLQFAPDFVGAGKQDMRQVTALLSTAYLIGADVAKSLVQALGGEQALFDSFRSQTPWVTTPVVDPSGLHGRTVRSDWYYVAEQEQSDPHETVCTICETLIAISPESEAAASDAVNPKGQPVTIGDHRFWSKNMPRRNLPGKARVAWNVAFRQILLARSASDSLTNYTWQMAELVKRTEKVFRSFSEKWIRGKSIVNADALAQEINEIVQTVNAIAYAAPEEPASVMTMRSADAGKDDTLGALLTGVLGNLLRRMSKLPGEEGAKAAATFAGSLAAQAREHEKSAIWRTTAQPPLRELGMLAERLNDAASILHEMAYDNGIAAIEEIVQAARKGNLGKAIHSAARRCRALADQRFKRNLKALEIALKDRGWKVACWCRPVEEADTVYWPAQEVAVLVEIADFETDARYIEDSLSIAQQQLGNDWRFRVVPVINGLVMAPLALLPSSHGPLPDQNFAKKWKPVIDHPFFSSELVDRFDEALAACIHLSGILTCRDLENLHPDESAVLSRSIDSFKRNRDLVADAAQTTGSEHLVWACDYLNQTWNQVVSELEAGQDAVDPLCMNPHRALAGEASHQAVEFGVARILMLQAECIAAAQNTSA